MTINIKEQEAGLFHFLLYRYTVPSASKTCNRHLLNNLRNGKDTSFYDDCSNDQNMKSQILLLTLATPFRLWALLLCICNKVFGAHDFHELSHLPYPMA